MGNCCKFIKRSRYRNDEKSVDPVGYKKTSNYNSEASNDSNFNQQRQISNGFLHQHQGGNTNPLAFQSDHSLNNKNKIFKTSQVNIQQHVQANGGSFKQKGSAQSNSVTIQPGKINVYENKLDDVNVSIPHIADFYPEGDFKSYKKNGNMFYANF